MTESYEYKKPGPRRSREGVFLGVCKGLAKWKSFPVFWVRFFFIIFALSTGIIAGLLMYLALGFALDIEETN